MKQAVMTAPGRIELRDVPPPEIAPDQVLVRMKRIGVCGSDIHVFHGKHPLTPYPVVQGHEASGVVERAGSAVRGLSPGDPVTFQPQVTPSSPARGSHRCTRTPSGSRRTRTGP